MKVVFFKILLFSALSCNYLFAQNIAIKNSGAAPDSSAILDVNSESKGVLIPRMTLAKRDSIKSPSIGLLIYQTNMNPGFYYFTGIIWASISTGTGGAEQHYVGEFLGGGIVFYVYNNGNHGLIASLSDVHDGISWGDGAINIINSESEYDGPSNTESIVTQLGSDSHHAAKICDAYTGGGFSDWYLPSIWELNLLFNEAFIISLKLNSDTNPATKGFSLSTNYWSSTERSTSEAWHQNFGFDYQHSNNSKIYLHRVRAVRKF